MTVILRNTIPAELQGRVYACRNTLQYFTIPIGLALGGAMVDHVCEPFMEYLRSRQMMSSLPPDRNWYGILFKLFGTGKGSGASLMMFLLGIAGILLCVLYGRKLKQFRYHDE